VTLEPCSACSARSPALRRLPSLPPALPAWAVGDRGSQPGGGRAGPCPTSRCRHISRDRARAALEGRPRSCLDTFRRGPRPGRPHVIPQGSPVSFPTTRIGAAGRKPVAISGEGRQGGGCICCARNATPLLVRDRHRAGGRSAADLPAAGHGAAIAGAGWCWIASLRISRHQPAGSFGARDAAVG